jgi:hypothetical protein
MSPFVEHNRAWVQKVTAVLSHGTPGLVPLSRETTEEQKLEKKQYITQISWTKLRTCPVHAPMLSFTRSSQPDNLFS